MELKNILYASRARRAPSTQALGELLAASRQCNRRSEVTGLLLHAGGCFVHYLEGPAPAVDETFRRVCDDARHYDIQTLLEQPLARRRLGGHPLKCVRVHQETCEELLTAAWPLGRHRDDAPSGAALLDGLVGACVAREPSRDRATAD